jgi:hypothetical protein
VLLTDRVLPHLRSLFARRPAVYWATVAAGASIVAFVVTDRLHAADEAREAWSTTTVVFVAAADVDPGAPLVVDPVTLPVAAVPTRAVSADPSGGVARREVVAGAVLTDLDVARATDELIPPGSGAVAIPIDDAVPPVVTGDLVDVVADGEIVSAGGTVIERGDTAVVVAVDHDDAPRVALAALERRATLVLRGR